MRFGIFWSSRRRGIRLGHDVVMPAPSGRLALSTAAGANFLMRTRPLGERNPSARWRAFALSVALVAFEWGTPALCAASGTPEDVRAQRIVGSPQYKAAVAAFD